MAFGLAAPTVQTAADDVLAGDPDVAAAQQELEDARAVVDAAYQAWLQSIAEHRSAELVSADAYVRDADGGIVGIRQGPRTDRARIAELAEGEKLARERLDVAQQRFVRMHDRLRQAQWRAQLRAAEPGRNGLSIST